jgi:hypothetical protein
MTAEERAHLIDQYGQGYDEVLESLRGFTDQDLDRGDSAGGWTARQIVHHLADSETTAYIRVRRLLAEDNPTIYSYDEERFAGALHYDRPIDASLDTLRAVRQATLGLLERLSEPEWARAGTHSDSGYYSVETWLATYAAHGHDHARQIRAARGEAVEG